MVKMRVYDSDGVLRGGLFNTEVFNRMSARVWDGPPHPDYRQELYDIGSGSWYLLHLSRNPVTSGATETSDLLDEDSRATRVTATEALLWFKETPLVPPADLVKQVEDDEYLASVRAYVLERGDKLRKAGLIVDALTDKHVADGSPAMDDGDPERGEFEPLLSALRELTTECSKLRRRQGQSNKAKAMMLIIWALTDPDAHVVQPPLFNVQASDRRRWVGGIPPAWGATLRSWPDVDSAVGVARGLFSLTTQSRAPRAKCTLPSPPAGMARRVPPRLPRPLTELQTEVFTLYQEHASFAEVGRRLGIDRGTARGHYRAATKKLGQAGVRTPRTRLQPTDRRGQTCISMEDDQRR